MCLHFIIICVCFRHKKDEFFLNRKRVPKMEVLSLLESAGFSKSNPYYFVQQGKVAHLCVMKDADRLNLLKEIAGTTIFEDRREESLKILEDTTNKQTKVGVRRHYWGFKFICVAICAAVCILNAGCVRLICTKFLMN